MTKLVSALLLLACFCSTSAQSLRGAGLDLQRELQIEANIIRTFSFSFVASQPQNPSNVSCLLLQMQGANKDWLNKTHPEEKLVSVNTPSVFTAGHSWPGSRRLATCNYLCVTQQTMSCRLCGSRNLHSTYGGGSTYNTGTNSTKANCTTTNTTTTNSTKTNTTATSNSTITKTELFVLEDVMKFLLPIFCPEFKNITSVTITVTEQYSA